MKIITESEMDFGKFDEADLFYIENSKINKNLGSGIKTVELYSVEIYSGYQECRRYYVVGWTTGGIKSQTAAVTENMGSGGGRSE